MIIGLLKTLFSGAQGRNVIKETVEVFRPNAEAQAQRNAAVTGTAQQQFAGEFLQPRQNWFDTMIDGMNRLPRPFMAFGVIGLIVSAMTNPAWFASRMVGLAAVPEPLWWLLGAIVSFYFGGRYQLKAQQFDVVKQAAIVPMVLESQRSIERAVNEDTPPSTMSDAEFDEAMTSQEPLPNDVILEWNKRHGADQ